MNSPREIDTELASKYNELYRLQDRFELHAHGVKSCAGAKFYYRGRQYVTDMTLTEAEGIVNDIIAKHKDESDYKLFDGGRNLGQIRHSIEGLNEMRQAILAARDEIDELQKRYTGWSRFFLVTSSKGHIHSSMSCSTCRPTTRYGWLPELSGQAEAEAVAEHGPALCSVCFPSAPTDWVGGWITKSQAEKKSA